MSVFKGGKGAAKRRRDERYRAAVGRQLLMHDCGYYDRFMTVRLDGERIPIRCSPAPIEQFLRPGDTVESCDWRSWAVKP